MDRSESAPVLNISLPPGNDGRAYSVVGAVAPHTRRHLAMVVGLATGILVVGLTAFVLVSSRRPSDVCTSGANADTLGQMVQALTSNSLTEQQRLTTKLRTLSGYNRDPNCLYVLTEYEINDGDLTSAKASDAELKKVYSGRAGFSPVLSPLAPSLTTLNSDLAYLEGLQQQAQHNVMVVQ